MKQLNLQARLSVGLFLLAAAVQAQFPGWDPRWPSAQKMLQGGNPQDVRDFKMESAFLAKNSRNANSLVRSAVFAGNLARSTRYGTFWLWLAAKDLEKAISIEPNNFAAWHNYGDVNHRTGNAWDPTDRSGPLRAVNAFNKALALNPKSARSYMGRGWSYLDMDDEARANADFQKALQLDPSLRADMQKEIGFIRERKAQVVAAKGTLEQMGRYYVETSATNYNECMRYRGYWTGRECRISMALYPGR